MRRFELAHPFFREAVQLSLASAAAQVVALAFSPAVLRRYDAGAFGVSSILIAVSGSVGQLSCLKYDLALLSLPREREESPLLKAALISVAASALLMGAAASIFGTSVNHILLMILTAAAVGCYTIGSAVCLRSPGPVSSDVPSCCGPPCRPRHSLRFQVGETRRPLCWPLT